MAAKTNDASTELLCQILASSSRIEGMLLMQAAQEEDDSREKEHKNEVVAFQSVVEDPFANFDFF